MQALQQAIHLMESDPHLALNAGMLSGLRPDSLTPGLWWFKGPVCRVDLDIDRYVHVVYRDIDSARSVRVSEGFLGYAPLRQVLPQHPLQHTFKFHGFCLIAVAPKRQCPVPSKGPVPYKFLPSSAPVIPVHF